MTRSSTNVHRFAVFTASFTFLLVIAGGLVTSTDSGLSVPDWPLSYGRLMPPMVGGILYEHGHRMVATFVGMLTVILAVWLWRKEDRRWVRNLGWIALAAVIVQGVLGGLTVLFLLPTPISVSHATLAQSFFSLMVVIALVTSPGWIAHRSTESLTIRRTRQLSLLAAGSVFVQLILGAWMRHSHAGMAIPDFPLSYGNLLPPHDQGGLALVNEIRSQLELPAVSLEQIWIHFAHRLGALVVTVAVFGSTVHILRTYKNDQRLREPAIIQLMLVLIQALLGALTVWSGKGVQVATAHVATGALLLAATVFVTVRSYHLYTAPETEEVYSMAPQTSRP